MDELFLAGHVPIKGRGTGSHLVGDPPHGEPLQADLVEDAQRRGDDRFPGQGGTGLTPPGWVPPGRVGHGIGRRGLQASTLPIIAAVMERHSTA